MRWLQTTKKDDRNSREPIPHVSIESVETSRPEGREGRLFDLVILSLFLHSAGSSSEMMSAFLEKAPSVTEAVFVYPLLLDKKRDVLTASRGSKVSSSLCSNARWTRCRKISRYWNSICR